MASKEYITLNNNGDYIHFTGTHSTQIIEYSVSNDSVFDGAGFIGVSGYYNNNTFTEITTEKDVEGTEIISNSATIYGIQYPDQTPKLGWYGIRLVNAGASTNIKVYFKYNSETVKTNKTINI